MVRKSDVHVAVDRMVREIDVGVVEDLVRDFGRARKKCPSITGVRLGSDGLEAIIIVDSDGNESEEVKLKFPDFLKLPE